jgi:hypothetical protein
MSDPKIEGALAAAQPISISHAAKLLGFKGCLRTAERRLRRYLLNRERITNETILLRVGTERLQRYLVTLPVLRQHCPELFDTRVEAEEQLREQFEDIEEKLHQLERRDEALAKALLSRGVPAGTTRDSSGRLPG